MQLEKLLRSAFAATSAIALAALLCACATSSNPVALENSARLASHGQTKFNRGGSYSFKVPAGITQLSVDASGAEGAPGNRTYDPTGLGGLGARVTATIPVTPGEHLAIFVGGSGDNGGFNGGGSICRSCSIAYGAGGGASDVRQGGRGLADRVLVAAGGGGGGADGAFCSNGSCYYANGGNGGNGGDRSGGTGASGHADLGGGGGGGGTQARGGEGGASTGSGCSGLRGKLGTGGYAGGGRRSKGCGAVGGGGGGGYYGGGGGGAGGYASQSSGEVGAGGGGGGGSSYAERAATHVKMTAGVRKGHGLIIITW